MASIAIQSVCKSFGIHQVLYDVSIDIGAGEFVILVGPSGCGKSTLLRMIAGLEDITAGDIRIGDRIVNDLAPKDRDVAMVFQNYALYPHMTVAENMAFSLKLAGASKAEKEAAVNRAADILDVSYLLSRLPKELSGGQRQRVAMGRAIVRDPEVFLFDEPLSNLDAKLRVQMRGEIKSLHQRLGTTMVYVTHDQVEAMTMADRIVVLNAGRVEQVGRPLDLYSRPANFFVASFIGSPAMNLLDGEITAGDGPLSFLSTRGVSLPLPEGVDLSPGSNVVYGIRPEHLNPTEAGQPDDGQGEILLVEPTGAETQVSFTLGFEKLVAAFRDWPIREPGDTLPFSVKRENIHLFDRETGLRLI